MRQQLTLMIGWTLVLLTITPGCPKDDATTEDGGASHQSDDANGSGGNGTAPMHEDGSGGKPSVSGSGGNSDHGNGTGGKVADDAMHDAGKQSEDQVKEDSGTPDRDGGKGAVCDKGCEVGMHCELVAMTQCLRAPCSTLAQCVPDAPKKFCGGFAGFACPGQGECVDDPSDDCDPMHGGADCGGICRCAKMSCEAGKHWNTSPEVCACVADDGSDEGPECGDTTCPKGQECCDALCGKCVEPGTFCTQGC